MKKILTSIAALTFLSAISVFAHEHADSDDKMKAAPAAASNAATTLKGEIVDMACYMDHSAQGEKHAGCAKTCISAGLPVGLKAANGKTYFVIGDHKPMNSELADYAGKTITLKGKVVSRDGFNMIENAEIVK